MIYLDNAATTYPKPLAVKNAVSLSLKKYGANPGRSGHKMSMDAAEEIYRCRLAVSNFFNAGGAENVMFTLNCTQATNTVIKGLIKQGEHIVVSCLEHNAVMRPIQTLANEKNVSYTEAKVYYQDNDKTLDSFRNAINEKTKLIVCIHASNVWGIRLPIERIAALGHQYNIPIMVDAAQSAGVLPIDVENDNIDYLCVAGHKGLYGPMGTGLLITKHGDKLKTLIEGGTGTNSISFEQPTVSPDKFESGTPNMPGISGLRAGIEFVNNKKIENIFKHEMKLITYLYDRLSLIEGVKLYTPRPTINYSVPLISFNIEGMLSEEVSYELNKNNIQVRAGLHCAAPAHKTFNTLETGAVRVCPSIFTTMREIDFLILNIKKIIKLSNKQLQYSKNMLK